MVWAYLGGPFEAPGRKFGILNDKERCSAQWFEESQKDFDRLRNKRNLELIWFNPWQHQFETSPLVALLNEVRRHFSLKRRAVNQAGKLADVSIHATLNALADLGKELKIPIPGAKGIMERGREYEGEHFSTPLPSQRFREFFEGAIRAVTGKNGMLVIFIDDLDRCEGDVAYRLLEALKLYVNAENCVYIVGMDQSHLERTIAKSLSGAAEAWRFLPMARDYLSKIFQNLFHLPLPRHLSKYVEELLDFGDEEFTGQLDQLFGITAGDRHKLVEALDQNLPHNPRKVKSFIGSWKLYLDNLSVPADNAKLDWRLTLILHYLAQFEEPLFRKVEEAPAFYSDQIVRFCRDGFSTNLIFEGLELPYDTSKPGSEIDQKGGLDSASTSSALDEATSQRNEDDRAASQPPPRVFWISRLVNELRTESGLSIDSETIYRHLLRSGGKSVGPARSYDSEDPSQTGSETSAE